MGMRWFILIFGSDPWLMALLDAGSRKIKDAHREKVRAKGRAGHWRGILFYRYLIYHQSLFELWTYTNKINQSKRVLRAYPLVFSHQALETVIIL